MIAISHITAVSLQQEGLGVAATGKTSTVIEDAPVTTVTIVPFRIIRSLSMRKLLVVCWQKTIAINNSTKNNAFIKLEQGFDNRWYETVGQRDKSCHELLRVGPGYRSILIIKELLSRYAAGVQFVLKKL